MHTYLIAQLNIHDRATYAKYSVAVGDTITRYGGKLLSAEEDAKVVEGEWNYMRTVLVEFPSEERANAWFQSAEYQGIVQDRLSASQGNLVFIRGIDA